MRSSTGPLSPQVTGIPELLDRELACATRPEHHVVDEHLQTSRQTKTGAQSSVKRAADDMYVNPKHQLKPHNWPSVSVRHRVRLLHIPQWLGASVTT